MKKLSLILPVVLTIFVTYLSQKTILANQEIVRMWVTSYGHWAILAYIGISLVTITLFPPLGGMAAAIAMWALYGPFVGTVIIWVVQNALFGLNFFLANRYGRNLVKKLLGENMLKNVDKFENLVSAKKIFLIKLLFGGYFDYLSYLLGLSKKVTLKDFVIINYVASIPSMIIVAFLLYFAPDLTTGVTLTYIITVVIFGVAVILSKRVRGLLQIEKIIETIRGTGTVG